MRVATRVVAKIYRPIFLNCVLLQRRVALFTRYASNYKNLKLAPLSSLETGLCDSALWSLRLVERLAQ